VIRNSPEYRQAELAQCITGELPSPALGAGARCEVGRIATAASRGQPLSAGHPSAENTAAHAAPGRSEVPGFRPVSSRRRAGSSPTEFAPDSSLRLSDLTRPRRSGNFTQRGVPVPVSLATTQTCQLQSGKVVDRAEMLSPSTAQPMQSIPTNRLVSAGQLSLNVPGSTTDWVGSCGSR